MKLLVCLMLGAGIAMPVWADARPPRPEAAIAQLELSPELREQVLAVFAAARERHDALRETLDNQRAANDAEFCAIRGETQKALAKLLSHEQLDALNSALRPPRPGHDERRGPGMRGSEGADDIDQRGDRPPHAQRPDDRSTPGAMQGHDGGRRRPPPPRCDEMMPPAEHGE